MNPSFTYYCTRCTPMRRAVTEVITRSRSPLGGRAMARLCTRHTLDRLLTPGSGGQRPVIEIRPVTR